MNSMIFLCKEEGKIITCKRYIWCLILRIPEYYYYIEGMMVRNEYGSYWPYNDHGNEIKYDVEMEIYDDNGNRLYLDNDVKVVLEVEDKYEDYYRNPSSEKKSDSYFFRRIEKKDKIMILISDKPFIVNLYIRSKIRPINHYTTIEEEEEIEEHYASFVPLEEVEQTITTLKQHKNIN